MHNNDGNRDIFQTIFFLIVIFSLFTVIGEAILLSLEDGTAIAKDSAMGGAIAKVNQTPNSGLFFGIGMGVLFVIAVILIWFTYSLALDTIPNNPYDTYDTSYQIPQPVHVQRIIADPSQRNLLPNPQDGGHPPPQTFSIRDIIVDQQTQQSPEVLSVSLPERYHQPRLCNPQDGGHSPSATVWYTANAQDRQPAKAGSAGTPKRNQVFHTVNQPLYNPQTIGGHTSTPVISVTRHAPPAQGVVVEKPTKVIKRYLVMPVEPFNSNDSLEPNEGDDYEGI